MPLRSPAEGGDQERMDRMDEEKKKKHPCPHGKRANLVILCRKPCEETGCRPTDLTYEKDAFIVTDYWCSHSCLWWKEHGGEFEVK